MYELEFHQLSLKEQIKKVNFSNPLKFSVLVADEEMEVFNELTECIGENGMMKLTHCKSANDLVVGFNNESAPDLIFLDVAFGCGKAYAIASYLKTRFIPKPTIVLMPYFGMTPLTMAVLSGCDEVICKPTPLDELMAVLINIRPDRF